MGFVPRKRKNFSIAGGLKRSDGVSSRVTSDLQRGSDSPLDLEGPRGGDRDRWAAAGGGRHVEPTGMSQHAECVCAFFYHLTSDQARLPAELKHITKRRKRN